MFSFLLLLAVVAVILPLHHSFMHTASLTRTGRSLKLHMGGNKAKFGIFSPAVVAAKFVIGEAKLNKIRGKAIALHSQAITEWCLQYGAYNLRLKLIKAAKKNGDELGFLV